MKKIFAIIITAVLMMVTLTACSTPVETVTITKDSIELKVGDWNTVNNFISYEYTPSDADTDDITWTSSNTEIATVANDNNRGAINPVGPGTCTITLTIGGKSDTIDVTVLLQPNISVIQTAGGVTVFTGLPVGTKLDVVLSDDVFVGEKTFILQQSNVEGSTSFSLEMEGMEALNGKYKLAISLSDMSEQPESVTSLIGMNGEFLGGHYVEITDAGKTIQYEKTLELPYKTELQKIQETPYSDLTKSQMLSIIKWIEDRYDYYDKQAGYYTGDKYTTTIFNEAADRYNKTYSQISTIWDRSYELKYT